MTHLERKIKAERKEIRRLERRISRQERTERNEAKRKRMKA